MSDCLLYLPHNIRIKFWLYLEISKTNVSQIAD